MGVPEAEVRMVEGTYEKTTDRVVVGEGASDEFDFKIYPHSNPSDMHLDSHLGLDHQYKC